MVKVQTKSARDWWTDMVAIKVSILQGILLYDDINSVFSKATTPFVSSFLPLQYKQSQHVIGGQTWLQSRLVYHKVFSCYGVINFVFWEATTPFVSSFLPLR
ncbi:uncharacterized protein LOC118192218, partial [Stegodyphus dumicola]|uniref:uncharacterized protein LOC118192218 n=1 Tax=Stegodyphus dumicola TaxID=202533 RepID=UPI0015AF9D94